MKTRGSVALLAAAAVLAAACSLPPVDLETQRPLPLRSTIVAADGSLLARLYKQNRAYVPLERIPLLLVHAVLAAEDARFFEHAGFDFRSIARAAAANLREGEVVQGGSTITQQYVKNTYFRHPGRTLERKARELRLAIELERRFSKREILERYLNTVYFGSGAYGVKAAAETYFQRQLDALSLPQAALLAAVIRAPSSYDPRVHPEPAKERRNYVLTRMAELGRVSSERVSRLVHRGLGVTPDAPDIATRDPYFVEAVRQEILRDPRLGPTPEDRDRQLREGGLRVATTLVPRLQSAAQEAAARALPDPADPEVALVAIRPKTGAIVAMVGGRDWSSSQVNLALGARGGGSGRQAGSSFKPILAAAALESGIGLDESYESSPATLATQGGEPWVVHNAEGVGYGLMALDEALIRSVNGVYARLGLQLGASRIAEFAHRMGIRSRLSPVHSIALGSEEVSVLDMASVYATLANRGTAITPTTIERIHRADGADLASRNGNATRVMSPGNAYLLTDVLTDVIERGTGTAAQIGRPAAGKTGTTNDYADAWFVGYTPNLVAAVWVGYPQGNVPMTSVHGISVSGGTFPAMIWGDFMSRALADAPIKDFTIPESALVAVEIDPVTGLLAAPWCPGPARMVLPELAPTEYCPPPAPASPAPTPQPSPTPTATPTPSPTKDEDADADKAEPAPEPTRTPKPKPTK
ncbi:hypothetical protein BH24ACT26_BH24ACT26_03540 [soil metagenome]